MTQAIIALEQSNSLTDLAARIRTEHEATSAALKRGVQHAMAAGDLLIEAKAQVSHGHWLAWLKANCEMSERTARLYMRLARNRQELEAKTATVADLNLRGALALISLPDDNLTVQLGGSIAESADSESVFAAYEKSNGEINIRKKIVDDAYATLGRIIEVAEVQPETAARAEAAWQEFGDELISAIADYTHALEIDLGVEFACSPQATLAADKAQKITVEMLRRVLGEAMS